MEITLQSVVFKDKVCSLKELYYREKGNAVPEENQITLKEKTEIRTNTYLNLLDCAIWKKYTSIEKIRLVMEVKGSGSIRVLYSENGTEEVIFAQYRVDSLNYVKKIIGFRGKYKSGTYYMGDLHFSAAKNDSKHKGFVSKQSFF